MSRIEKLTKEQESRLVEFRDKWIEIGLCTDAASRSEAERGVNMAYAIAGLKPPQKIVWCGSPLSQGLTRAIILNMKPINQIGDSVGYSVWQSVRDSVSYSVWQSVRDSVRDSVSDSVWDSVWDSVRDSVRDRVRDRVGDSVRDSVGDSVGDSVRDSVWDSVWNSVWQSVGDSVRDSVWQSVWQSVGDSVRDRVRDSVGDSVRDSVRDSVWDSVSDSVWDSVRDSVRDSVWQSVWQSVSDSVGYSVYGQHDAHWLAFYDYFKEVCSMTTQTETLKGLWLQAKNAGWWLPHKNICWLSERHNILERDERGRIHSLSGPAIAFPDGWAIYAVHGVRVPAWIIEKPNDISIKTIDEENNAEVRRVMLDRFGWDKYLIQSGAKKIHSDKYGELYRKEIDGDEPLVMVKVIDATPKYEGYGKGLSADEKSALLKDNPAAFANYFLRVPPDIKTAHEAVAWTFNDTPEDYQPVFES